MDRQLAITLAVTAPLVVVGAVAAGWLQAPPSDTSPQQLSIRSTPPPRVHEFCQRAADMLHEVTWAAACHARKDDNDCMLPESQAARVNALMDAEASRCVAVETQSRR